MTTRKRYSRRQSPLFKTRLFVKRNWRRFQRASTRKKVLVVAAPILAFLIITPVITYIYFYNDIANQDRLMNRNNTGIVLKDKRGKIFYSLGRAEHRELTKLDGISDITEKALVASEDKDFYEHSGFSFFSIARSLYSNFLAGDATAYGGSTLTQQLAKNTLLSTDQTILRKYQELTISMAIEQRYDKNEILEMYLNSVYFGNNSFGIEEAAENYFGKKASQLTLPEASMLVGVLPAPSAYSPVDGTMKYALERQNTVLSRMVENGYITEAQKTAAQKVKLSYRPAKVIDNAAPHFTEMVLSELYKKYGEEKVKRSGYQVETTLDLTLQKRANESTNANLAHIQANGGSNASVVAVDPKTGEIRALVGSIDYTNKSFGQVNMATSPRQPGSSFKPIYYAKALADGDITPVTVFRDEASDFNGYKPQNATRQYYGDVTVRQALSWSLNIPAVKVLQRVGISSAIDQAKALGITSLGSASDYGLSLALGAGEVPLTQMTGAYATFANGGERRSLTTVDSIEDKFDKTIYVEQERSERAISEEGAYLVSNILSDNNARAGMFGSALNVYGNDWQLKQVAVKTGTTDESRDAWTIGYTPEIAVGVWVGNNDNTPMLSGGSDMAGPIWREVMKTAIGSSKPTFVQPSGVVKKTVCISKGILTDVFLIDNVPTSTCSTTPKKEQPKKPEEKKEEKPKQEEPAPVTEPIPEQPIEEQPPTDTTEDPTPGLGRKPSILSATL